MAREQQPQRGRGRFNGGRGGRGNRFAGRGYQRGGGRTSNNQQQQKELKFAPHTQGKPQSATYATVKEAVVQQVQKTFKHGSNVAKSLKHLKLIDVSAEEPMRSISTNPNKDQATTEQKGMDIK